MQDQFQLPQDAAAWYALPVHERNAQNNQVIDAQLMPWSDLLATTQSHQKVKLKQAHMVFFHIPKTGGTTLNHVIAKNIQVNGLYHINSNDFDRHIVGAFKKGHLFPNLVGHFELNDYFYQLLERPRLIHITMIREPVSRVLSYYDYLCGSKHHPLHEIARELDLTEFLAHPKIKEIHNGQSHRLLGLLKQANWQQEPRSEAQLIADVRHQLEHRFSFFGLTEQYDQFLLMSQQFLQWGDVFYRKMKQAKHKTQQSTLPASTIEQIKEMNVLDVELYEFAVDLFNRRCAQLGINDHLVNTFRQLNQQYDRLLDWQDRL